VPTVVTLPREERAFAVAQAILQNPAESKTMAALCAEAGVSVRTIERTFRNGVGTSFESWRRQVRLTKAVELLVSGCSIKEVTYKVGYCQSSAFVEMFRRTFGTTPKAWISALIPLANDPPYYTQAFPLHLSAQARLSGTEAIP
jgi:AraC-like DNA-binding protein